MRNVVIGFLGTQLDMGRRRGWKPSVSLCSDPSFRVDRLELLYDAAFLRLAETLRAEIAERAPHTEVLLRRLDLKDPWDFEEVYGKLFDFAQDYGFDEERESYHVHLTTGTHVAQICWFLLAESRHIPARLVQTGPPNSEGTAPKLDLIDLDLRRYNALQQRFDLAIEAQNTLLKGGIETADPAYNALIARLDQVVSRSDGPVLLMGERGTGKSALAARIHELKLKHRRVKGRLVQINCAALNEESALFGARGERKGLLHEANGGVLLLDEVEALSLSAQAGLAQTIETGRYLPLGTDHEVTSRFHLIATSSADLPRLAQEDRFRADLLAQLSLWTFTLPPLRDRGADIESNLAHELARAARVLGTQTGFNADARALFLRASAALPWPENFRDFGAVVRRLCTLAPRGRITKALVEAEIAALKTRALGRDSDPDAAVLAEVLGARAEEIDPFERAQLAAVICACARAPSLSEAGRRLFKHSRQARASTNDADRLRKYLARFGLDWAGLKARG